LIKKSAAAALVLLCACSRKEAPSPVVRQEVFADIAGKSGLIFTHATGAVGELHIPEIMGAGAALFDYDNDGDLDVFLVQSKGASQLFRNELVPGGALKFTDVTALSGIAYAGYGMGAATGDFDNDGHVDLLITGWQQTELYRNNGNGTFARAEFPFPKVWSTSASFFDYDRDRLLDLVVLSYVDFNTTIHKKCQAATGESDYCTPRAYAPVSARLYRNEGSGKFRDTTEQAGLNRALGPGLGVAAADLNNDGWPDLFVANDTAPNHVWVNQRDGTFREKGIEAGAAYSEDGLAKAGMGVAAGDFDDDGDEDLFVVNLMREGATLLRNETPPSFETPSFLDITRSSGLYQITFDGTGFGTNWIDYDNDGLLDLFIANGAVTRREEQRGQARPYREQNKLIRNLGGGMFRDVSDESGVLFSQRGISRGAAFGDIDNDGDTDIVVTQNGGPAQLLRNQLRVTGWVSVRALDKNRRDAYGAKVFLHRDDLPALMRRVHTDSSYCSAGDPRVHFGLGDKSRIGSIEIHWFDGSRERWRSPKSGRLLTLQQGTGEQTAR